MSQFLGTHQNRLDAKGRVSVPAPFRALLKGADGSASLVLRPSHQHRCIEVWPAAAFHALSKSLEGFELFSEEYEDKATSLFADAYPIETDREGRILLPESLVAHAQLSDSVTFLGIGSTFHIWEPAAAAAFKEAARERARARSATSSAQRPVPAA
jgi:MraZ protein